MGTVYALLISYKDYENKMREAALSEEYSEANRLKVNRDDAKKAAVENLLEVQQEFLGGTNDIDHDLSLSTIKDESFVSHKSTHSTESYDSDQGSIVGKLRSPIRLNGSQHTQSSVHEDSLDDKSDCSNSKRDEYDTNAPHLHPLAGIDNADDLPAPEEISNDVSPDLVQKAGDLFGSYRTKCLFSKVSLYLRVYLVMHLPVNLLHVSVHLKNWKLRDAALAKICMLVPERFADCADVASTLGLIVARCIDDNNVQVYQSGLILLDEVLLQCEQRGLSQSKSTALLSNIITDVIAKLADSSRKVVESAELSLLAMSHSSCIGITCISNHVTKKIRSADSKHGRTVKARLLFIEQMIAEFGNEVPFKRVIDFARGKLIKIVEIYRKYSQTWLFFFSTLSFQSF